jgi:hypothetical protein
MQRTELPAVVTAGSEDLQKRLARLERELRSGACVHLMGRQTGRHRGWLVREQPGGSDPVVIQLAGLKRRMGEVLDRVRDGEVFEVTDGRRKCVVGFLTWTAPDCIAALDAMLPYAQRTARGPARQRLIRPQAVQAEPTPWQRKKAMAGA